MQSKSRLLHFAPFFGVLRPPSLGRLLAPWPLCLLLLLRARPVYFHSLPSSLRCFALCYFVLWPSSLCFAVFLFVDFAALVVALPASAARLIGRSFCGCCPNALLSCSAAVLLALFARC